MKLLLKLTILLSLLTGLCLAADVRCTWLPFSSNVTGLAATSTPTTQYGVSVLMDSDNPKVTEFQVLLTIKRGDGTITTFTSTVAKLSKAADVQYSTLYSALVDDSPNFQVLALQVKAVSGVSASQPVPGMPYSRDGQ